VDFGCRRSWRVASKCLNGRTPYVSDATFCWMCLSNRTRKAAESALKP
jgi:hypothetical protein